MKNLNYLSILLMFLVWGCTDENKVQPDRPQYDVAFSISDQAGSPVKLADSKTQESLSASLFDQVSAVSLFVYNSKGYLADQKTIWNPENNISVSGLEEGTYTAVAVGHDESYFIGMERLATALFNKHYPGQVFVDKVDFTVGPSEAGTVKMMLKRQVGMLELDITDEPTNETIAVRVSLEAMAAQFSLRSLLPVGNSDVIYFQDWPHTKNYTDLPGYFFVPGNSQSYNTSVLIQLVNQYGDVLKSQRIRDVKLGVNKKTTIRGKFYDSLPQQFTVTFDEEWSDEDTIDF